MIVPEDKTAKLRQKQSYVLVGNTEYHDLSTSDDQMERILVLRETEDDRVHVLSINRKLLEVLMQECGNKKSKSKPNKPARVKAIQTKATHVCPDCQAQLEVSLDVEVDNKHWGEEALLKHLRKENRKQAKRLNLLHQERKHLQQQNQKLLESAQATKDAFDTLNQFAKKKNIENAQLKKLHRSAQQGSKHQLEKQREKFEEQLRVQQQQFQEETKQLEEQRKETYMAWGMVEKLRAKHRALSRQLREICPTPSFKL